MCKKFQYIYLTINADLCVKCQYVVLRSANSDVMFINMLPTDVISDNTQCSSNNI